MNIISKEYPKQYGKIKEVSCDSKGVSWSLRVDNGKQTGPSLAFHVFALALREGSAIFAYLFLFFSLFFSFPVTLIKL